MPAITTSTPTAAVPTAVIVTAATGSRTEPPLTTSAPAPTTTTTTTARPPNRHPWMCIQGETTPNRAYLTHYRDGVNSLHPSCSVAADTPTPMETDGGEVRTVSYRDVRAPGHRDRADRDARRDRQREERDQERERCATRRHGDGRTDGRAGGGTE